MPHSVMALKVKEVKEQVYECQLQLPPYVCQPSVVSLFWKAKCLSGKEASKAESVM